MNNKTSNAAGFIWRYKNDNFIFSPNKSSRICRKRKTTSNDIIYQYDRSGELIQELYYKDIIDDRVSILRCLNGNRAIYKDFTYSKVKLSKEEVNDRFSGLSKRIYQYTLNGELIKVWESGNELLRVTKMATSTLFDENGELIKRGFLWKNKL